MREFFYQLSSDGNNIHLQIEIDLTVIELSATSTDISDW